MLVSQFTLLASTKKGNKPDFHGAAGGDEAKRLYQYFFERVQKGYHADKVKDGVFQAMMEVALVNDGPVRSILRHFADNHRSDPLLGDTRAQCESSPTAAGKKDFITQSYAIDTHDRHRPA